MSTITIEVPDELSDLDNDQDRQFAVPCARIVSITRITPSLRRQIIERAGTRCEYCLLPAEVCFFPHEIDHVIAEKHGGKTESDNLAFATRSAGERLTLSMTRRFCLMLSTFLIALTIPSQWPAQYQAQSVANAKGRRAKKPINESGTTSSSVETDSDCLRPNAPKPIVTLDRGVLNRSAIKLPQPKYPAEAKTANVSGEVKANVVVDLASGKVVCAQIESGHPLLRAPVAQVVCKARFEPICLGPPVRVSGVLMYGSRIRKPSNLPGP